MDSVNTGLVFAGDIFVDEIRWVGFNGAGDSVDLTDGSNRSVFTFTAQNAGDIISTNFGEHTIIHGGIKLPTLSSGKVYIYIK